jgi:hypothetical protein
MANTKISNLTGAASVTDTSVFPVVDSGSTKKVTGTQIKTYARSGLSTVAVSGSYTDLTSKPTLFDGNYNSLTNKPTLFDGNYNSLTNKPTLFDGSYTSLTSKPTLFDGDYNSLTNKPIISDTTTLTGGDFFIAKDNTTIVLGQWAAQTLVFGDQGIILGGTGGVRITGAAGSGITLGGGSTGTITVSSPTTGISYDDLTNKPTIPTDVADLTDNNNLLGGAGGGSGGSSFDQTLNTTDNVTFNQVTSPSYYFPSGSISEQAGDPTRLDIVLDSESNVIVRTNEGGSQWSFGNDGSLTMPQGIVSTNTLTATTTTTNDIDLYTNNWTGGGVEVWLQHDNQVSINTDNGNHSWRFTKTGEFQFPNYVKQTNFGSVFCQPNVDTVIYTGTDQYQHTFKLLLQVEGSDSGQAWDTQSCEMMVAKSFINDKVAGSVYGLVYTSNSPLATFTTRWNAISNRVEVLCRPSSTSYPVTVRSFATEMSTSY